MRKLLVINSSPREDRSQSRKLTEIFIASWKEQFAEHVITFSDLRDTTIPHVTEDWKAGTFKPESGRSKAEIDALKISTELIAELPGIESLERHWTTYTFL